MTPQSPGVPQHIQIELARRELKALQSQQSIAKYGVDLLSKVAEDLTTATGPRMPNTDYSREDTRVILSALVALVSLRLQELQNSHAAIQPRIAELENALRVADSGIIRPV